MIIILKILTDRATIRYKGYFISTRFMDDCLLNITHYQRHCHQCHFDDTKVIFFWYQYALNELQI